MSSKEIFVYADWQGMAKPTLIGTLFADIIRGREVFSFEYDDAWLSSHSYSFFDPDLSHYIGRQYLPNQKSLFGIFTDSCPDRWGRTLMKRRETMAAKEEARQVRTLLESDYLLGVDDFCRTGALRFKLNPKGAFLSDSDNPIPIWTDLRALEQSALFLDSDTQNTASEKKCLKMLLSPGSSLGGARPKATVSALDGSLWIAKFPSKKDSADVGAWEMVVHELALSAGLNVPSAKCEQFSKYGSTFLVKRFDRNNIGKRVHYISAMTVLGKSDGDSDSTSYLDIANAVRQYGANVQTDLTELWSRIAFSIAVGNSDDHLRNHGFILTDTGLRLAPMFDVNPNPDAAGLSLNIDENSNALDFELLLSVAPHFDLSEDAASDIVFRIRNAVSDWQTVAKHYHISSREQSEYSPAFKRI